MTISYDKSCISILFARAPLTICVRSSIIKECINFSTARMQPKSLSLIMYSKKFKIFSNIRVQICVSFSLNNYLFKLAHAYNEKKSVSTHFPPPQPIRL